MKLLFLQILLFIRDKKARKNSILLGKFLLLLALTVTFYSVVFHLLMAYEGRDFSWITGFYWTMTVMSTLGFGDITFSTDLGLMFTLMVLFSGVILMLIMLPFTFIQFFYEPWLKAQIQSRTPRELPADTKDHIIFTSFDSISSNLARKLTRLNYQYCFIIADQQRAMEIYDSGFKVVLGEVDAPETYTRIQADQAALVVATANDLINTNVSFTVREVSKNVPIATSADHEHSLDILNFPANTHVFPFMKMLGIIMAEKSLPVRKAHIIDTFAELAIAEFPVRETKLAGKTIAEAQLNKRHGLTVIGILEKGELHPPFPQTTFALTNILIVAGSADDIDKTDDLFPPDKDIQNNGPAVLILGGGRVGEAAAQYLESKNISHIIVEKRASFHKDGSSSIKGNAADIKILEKAGIKNARSVIITTHDDAMNIYLSFYCRQLRPDIQIISRATQERTIPKLHRAGADIVNSSAAMGADHILDLLHPTDNSIFSEALNIFATDIPPQFMGRSLSDLAVRERTKCSILAVRQENRLITSPDAATIFTKPGELIMAGPLESEKLFHSEFS